MPNKTQKTTSTKKNSVGKNPSKVVMKPEHYYKFRTKQQGIALISNLIEDIRKDSINKRGERFLETTQYLKWLMECGQIALDEHLESLKMQELRLALQEAYQLAIIIQ